jgi:hypothetical protein
MGTIFSVQTAARHRRSRTDAGAMRGSASFAGWAAGGIVVRDVLGSIVTSVFILNSSYGRQMLCGPDSQLGASPRRMRPSAFSCALMS